MEEKETRDTDLEQELEALYRKVANTGHQGDSPYPSPQAEWETAAPEEPVLLEMTAGAPSPPQEGRTRRLLPIAMGLMVFLSLICMVAIFFWPTIYYYESLNLGEKFYPMRINKLTGEVLYFNGSEWLSPPAAGTAKKPAYGALKSPTPIASPETNLIKNREEPKKPPAPPKTSDKGRYVIQIKSFPENSLSEAQAFMMDVKKKIPDIQMKTVQIAGHGIWYRIWVGNFSTTQEASQAMKLLKLTDSYPDSFIRRQSGE